MVYDWYDQLSSMSPMVYGVAILFVSGWVVTQPVTKEMWWLNCDEMVMVGVVGDERDVDAAYFVVEVVVWYGWFLWRIMVHWRLGVV